MSTQKLPMVWTERRAKPRIIAASTAMPVRVGGEADGRVEGRVRRDGCEALGVQRQHTLQPLQRVDRQQPAQIEEQHRQRIRLPRHLFVRADAREPVDEALEPAERAIETAAAARVDASHVRAERLREGEQDDHIEAELEDQVAGHSNTLTKTPSRSRNGTMTAANAVQLSRG